MQTFSSPGFEPITLKILLNETTYGMSYTDTTVEVKLTTPAPVAITTPTALREPGISGQLIGGLADYVIN